jgi:hypothetical protein
MKKMGESQVIQFFTTALQDEMQKVYGSKHVYALGNFSGSQDRKFADFFCGTDSVNILIEFKEFKSEHRAEVDKPLRERLCKTLTADVARVSRSCHFIGWGKNGFNFNVELNSYIDLVCSLWGGVGHLVDPIDHLHEPFIDEFVGGRIGVAYEEFVDYVEQLNIVAGGSALGDKISFRSILFSRGGDGRVKANKFDNLGELRALIKLKPSIRIKPSNGSGPSWP